MSKNVYAVFVGTMPGVWYWSLGSHCHAPSSLLYISAGPWLTNIAPHRVSLHEICNWPRFCGYLALFLQITTWPADCKSSDLETYNKFLQTKPEDPLQYPAKAVALKGTHGPLCSTSGMQQSIHVGSMWSTPHAAMT
jgi:hypothetical protein